MKLLVDVGNTRLKWATQAGAAPLQRGGALAHGGEALGAALEHAWRALQGIEAVWIASVGAPAQEQALADLVQARFGCIARFARSPAQALGIREVVGEFTTRYPAGQPRVKNIKRIAELMQNVVIEPGQTFSINEFIGKGLGKYLLNWAVDQAWSYGPEKLTVDTCTLDHPRAIGEYQRAGFRPVKQVQKRMLDPRLEGYAPMHVIPRLPELTEG